MGRHAAPAEGAQPERRHTVRDLAVLAAVSAVAGAVAVLWGGGAWPVALGGGAAAAVVVVAAVLVARSVPGPRP